MKIRDDNGKHFIATLYNVLFAPDLCHQFFFIIMSMHFGHTYLFNKGFCVVLFGANQQNLTTILNSAKRKHAFLIKTK